MKRLLALALLASACAPAWADEVRCLQSTGGSKPIRLSLTVFSTEQGERSRAGTVLYAGQADSLPIVYKSSEVIDEIEDRPWEYLSTWLEVLPGEERIGGRYSFHHQGAVVFDFQYHNLRTGKTYHFEENPAVLDPYNTCSWPE